MKKIKLKEIFQGLQVQMEAKLTLSRSVIPHPGTVGEVSELEWLGLLKNFLPKRYCFDKGFVVDSTGSVSDQIDIIVYDRHYTPFVFHTNGAKYIPAEAVYAIIECKQNISKAHIQYAAHKASSVRKLKRTSIGFMQATGPTEPKPLHNILAGIVCLDGTISNGSKAYLKTLSADEMLTFVCSLSGTYAHVKKLDIWGDNNSPHEYDIQNGKPSLVMLTMNLIGDLQEIGTAPALNVKEYLSNI